MDLEDNLIIFGIGGLGYGLIEILYRGYTHWTMILTGGVLFFILFHFNRRYRNEPLWRRCLAGAVIITAVEFVVGYVVNILLGWNVWDYSGNGIQLMGQISLISSVMWFFLCYPIAWLTRLLSREPRRVLK